MSTVLTQEGYEQTKRKLSRLEKRLADLDDRKDVSELHLAESRQSYSDMIRQYRREIKEYEANVARTILSTKIGHL
jgi:polyhydroxyalkanoate synthesis regulator phasin